MERRKRERKGKAKAVGGKFGEIFGWKGVGRKAKMAIRKEKARASQSHQIKR